MTEGGGIPRVLLISSDTVGPNMAGTGIRYWNLARVIASEQRVTLVTPAPAALEPPPGVTLRSYAGANNDERGHNLARLVEEHDVVVAQHLPYHYTSDEVLRARFLIVDMYAPWILEKLEHARIDPEVGEPNRKDDVAILNRLLRLGDAFVCASERQRDFWLGTLASSGRLDLAQSKASPDLRKLIDVVPFGLPSEPPAMTGPGPRQLINGIDQNDIVILWNGGIWNWLDPFTAISAMREVVAREPRAKLIFMGVKTPVAEIAKMRVVEDARSLSAELGLLNRHVFFNDWVPYDQRQNWLLQADVGLTLHVESIEARYAYRTRVLDNLWCRLPVIATVGDVLADLVDNETIGVTVPPGDSNAVAEAILSAIEPARRDAYQVNLERVARKHTWETVAKPLLEWCAHPIKTRESADDPRDRYVHDLERVYSETAEYARRLEHVIVEKNAEIESQRLTMRNLATLIVKRIKRTVRRE